MSFLRVAREIYTHRRSSVQGERHFKGLNVQATHHELTELLCDHTLFSRANIRACVTIFVCLCVCLLHVHFTNKHSLLLCI